MQHPSNTGEVTKRLVVDGQQRITTLQLLIKATEQEFQSQDDTVRAARLQKLITNQESLLGSGDPNNQTKIRSNLSDQAAFQAAIRSLIVITRISLGLLAKLIDIFRYLWAIG